MIPNSEFTHTRYCSNKLANYVGKDFTCKGDDKIFHLGILNLKFDTVEVKWENKSVDYSVESAMKYIDDGLWIFKEPITQ